MHGPVNAGPHDSAPAARPGSAGSTVADGYFRSPASDASVSGAIVTWAG